MKRCERSAALRRCHAHEAMRHSIKSERRRYVEIYERVSMSRKRHHRRVLMSYEEARVIIYRQQACYEEQERADAE